jgi:hypothetical protein
MTVAAAEFRLTELQPRLSAGALVLAGGFELTLGPKVEEALAKGIALQVVIEVQLYKHRSWLWNQTLEERILRRQIRYHALTGQYVVNPKQADSDVAESFATLTEALRFMGALNDLTLPLAQPPDPEGDYRVRLRARLDIESLPAPLRPVAYATPSWHLNSGWTTWKAAR